MRKEEEWPVHDQVVDAVATQRMNYPSENHPNSQTYTNPDQEKNFFVNGDNKVWPDLVVIDTKRKAVIIIGEVETESTVNNESAEQWKDYSTRSGDFYLYVPHGYEDEAKRLLNLNGIRCSGIRTYWFENSHVKFAEVK